MQHLNSVIDALISDHRQILIQIARLACLFCPARARTDAATTNSDPAARRSYSERGRRRQLLLAATRQQQRASYQWRSTIDQSDFV
jgi:hypothetical protein